MTALSLRKQIKINPEMTADNMEFDEISFNEFDGKLSIPEDSNRATGKRTAASMSITSDVRSVATGTTGGDNQAIIAICESRGNLSEVGIAVFITERNVCLVQQVVADTFRMN